MRVLWVCSLALVFGAWAQIPELNALDWSSDGAHLLLVVKGHLYWAPADSPQDMRPLYPEMVTDWARFGPEDWFVFVAPWEEGFALWRGFLDGREPELLFQSPYPLRWPTVSADGNKVAFIEDWETLVVLELAEGRARRVLGGPWPKATPEFLPAGQALVFVGLWLFPDEPSWEIFYLDLGSLNLLQLTSDAYFDWCPRISPDGLWVAFVSNRGGFSDIWIQSLQGGPPFPVTEDPWEDAFPCWSPDGLVLGYASFRLEGWQFLRAGTY